VTADWRHRAACLGEDPELFFPIGTSGPALTDLADAQRVCATCPVRDRCLQWAVDHNVDHGVWGGLGEDQRKYLRRRSARCRKGPPVATVSSARRVNVGKSGGTESSTAQRVVG
jgi:WhiB family redox-sensing transcriptional regulator